MKNMVGVIRYVTGYNAFSVSNLGSVPLIMYVKCNDGKKILSVEGNVIVSIQEVNAGKADYMAERYYKRSAGLLIDNMSGYDLISLCWLNRLEKIPLNLLFRTGRLENMNAFVVCVIRWSMNRVLHTEAKKGSMKKNGYCFSMSIQKGNFVCYENDTPEKGELNIYDITGSFAEAVIRENIETDVPFSYLSGRYLFRLYTECVLPVRYVVKDGDILFLISCKREEDKCRNRIYEFVLEGFHI